MNHPKTLPFVTLLVAVLMLSGCSWPSLLITPVSSSREMRERVIMRDSAFASDKIALIDVSGTIYNGEGLSLLGYGVNPVVRLREQLDQARCDDRVKAVILRINSPGGTVVASEVMHDEIRHFRKKTGKPVIAVMMDVAASGGYYIACACDEIIASPSTVTGSIGVVMQMFEVSGTLVKLGITTDAIISGPNKDAGSPLRTMTADERAIFQEIVDRMYERFVMVVDEGRPELSTERVRELADGRLYLADQALEAGLVDRIATLREAVGIVKKRIGSEKVKLVVYARPAQYRPNYYANTPDSTATLQRDINLIKIEAGDLLSPPAPQFMYLWQPGR